MPELPDVTVYIEALRERILGRKFIRAQIRGPFLLRLKNLPDVKKQMLADVKAMASLKPEMSGDGKVASFVLKGEDVPDRTIRLSLENGDWLLVDSPGACPPSPGQVGRSRGTGTSAALRSQSPLVRPK